MSLVGQASEAALRAHALSRFAVVYASANPALLGLRGSRKMSAARSHIKVDSSSAQVIVVPAKKISAILKASALKEIGFLHALDRSWR